MGEKRFRMTESLVRKCLHKIPDFLLSAVYDHFLLGNVIKILNPEFVFSDP